MYIGFVRVSEHVYRSDGSCRYRAFLTSVEIIAGFVLVNSVGASGAALLPQVLEKIFATLVYVPEDQKNGLRSKNLKNVRKHAASLIVKIGWYQ